MNTQIKNQPLPTNPAIEALLAPFEREFQDHIVSKNMKFNRFERFFGFFFSGTELQAVAKQKDEADAKELLSLFILRKEQWLETMMDDNRTDADIDIAIAGINLFEAAKAAL